MEMVRQKPILGFTGKYEFLSNFFPCPVYYQHVWYGSSEAAFQAQKLVDPEMRKLVFSDLKAKEAKRLGRKVIPRDDWDDIRDAVMWQALRAKFYFNLSLVEKLLETGHSELVETNTWGDKYWGVCGCVGENRLGCMLMKIRNQYQGIPVHYGRKLLRSLAAYNIHPNDWRDCYDPTGKR